ncbi:YdbH domain-containing protein [Endozoicomonas sp. SM1973]|uniref:YdbH domain-containing protein n=1 Tax=Spartinivicinus marinus TaxID=2994442 RepID=A0A853I3Z5_9GAMM|nr:YdbH domain-containing protein [Spartinivicinus marinus]MCX4028092.1 YdbH domain-containing protein [Spartinivicinus marinus]NYZ66232.1 YdbH domain-containing protein [Spartinivicinus marinus]
MILKTIKWLLILLTLIFSLILTTWLTTPIWLVKLTNYFIAPYDLQIHSQKITTHWPFQLNINNLDLINTNNHDKQPLIQIEQLTLSLHLLPDSQLPLEITISMNDSTLQLEQLKALKPTASEDTTLTSWSINDLLGIPISWKISNLTIDRRQHPTVSLFSYLEQSQTGPQFKLHLTHNEQTFLTINTQWQTDNNQLINEVSVIPAALTSLLDISEPLTFLTPDNSQLTANLKLNLPESFRTADFLNKSQLKRISGNGTIQYQATSTMGEITIDANWQQQQGTFTAKLIPHIHWNNPSTNLHSTSAPNTQTNGANNASKPLLLPPKKITFFCQSPLEIIYQFNQQQANLSGECRTNLTHPQYQLQLTSQLESTNKLTQWHVYSKLHGQLAPATESTNQFNGQLNGNIQLAANSISFQLTDSATASLTTAEFEPYAANAVQLLIKQLSADITDLNKPDSSFKLSTLFDLTLNQPTLFSQPISPKITSQHQVKTINQLTEYQGNWQIDQTATLTKQLQWQLGEQQAAINWQLKVSDAAQLANYLAPIIPNWPTSLSIQSGQFSNSFSGTVLFNPLLISGKMLSTLNQFNLLYEKNNLNNINGELQFRVKNNHVTSSNSHPNSLKVKLIDIGIPIETISTQLRFNSNLSQPDQTIIQLKQLKANLLGGTITAPRLNLIPFSNQQITISVKAIDLAKLVALEQQPAVTASGIINGKLPIKVVNNKPSINNGTLQATGAGWIKVNQPSLTESLSASNESLKLALSALANFQYDRLESDVALAPNGDLVLSVSLAGKNPDFYQGKRIHFNYKQEENIYLLIKSVQLGQYIGENVTKKLQRPSKD